MDNKTKILKLIPVVITIIISIIAIIIFANQTQAGELSFVEELTAAEPTSTSVAEGVGTDGYSGYSYVKGKIATAQLAQAVAYISDKFLAEEPAKIFGLNSKAIGVYGGTYRQPLGNIAGLSWGTDIYYNSSICLYHKQSTTTTSSEHEIANIIDINYDGDGKIKIYNKSSSSTPAYTLDDSRNTTTSDKNIAGNKKYRLGMQMAYLAAKISEQDTKYITTSGTRNITLQVKDYDTGNVTGTQTYTVDQSMDDEIIKGTIYNLWHAYGLKEYLLNLNVLDTAFYTGVSSTETTTHTTGSWNQAVLFDAQHVANNITTDGVIVSIEKVYDTKPKVIYENGNTYIGPMKVTYTGTGTQLTIEGKEAKWATKNTSGVYEIQDGNVTSGMEFYAVLEGEKLEATSELTVKMVAKAKSYRARIMLLTCVQNDSQQLMYYAGDEIDVEREVEWISEPAVEPGEYTIELVKVDSANNSKKLQGAQFTITVNGTEKNYTTGTDGKITISGVLTSSAKQTIKIKETKAPDGYISLLTKEITITGTVGVNSDNKYAITNYSLTNQQDSTVKLVGNTITVTVPNEKMTGLYDIQLLKIDNENSDNKLKGAEFKVSINGGTAKTYTTNEKGILSIEDIEITSKDTQKIEIQETTPPTGYDPIFTGTLKLEATVKVVDQKYEVSGVTIANSGTITGCNVSMIEDTTGSTNTISLTVENKQKPKDGIISGYVWLDKTDGKSNSYDDVYVDGTSDIRKQGIEVRLYDGTVLKDTTTTDENGEYKFEIKDMAASESLENYIIKFFYDGLEYTTVGKIDDNKATEDFDTRQTLNEQYSIVTNGSPQVSNTNVSATTEKIENYTAEIDYYGESTVVEKISYENINLGLREREQPDIALRSDLDTVIMKLNESAYEYKYGSRTYTDIYDVGVQVGFENKYVSGAYYRPVYASDVQALKDGTAELEVEVMYKITLVNQSSTLIMSVGSIVNHFDSNFDKITALGFNREEILNNNDESDDRTITYTEDVRFGSVWIYLAHDNSTNKDVMMLQQKEENENHTGLLLEPQTTKDIYIKYQVSREALISLLQDKEELLHNISEVTSYTSYYGNNVETISETYKGLGDESKVGDLYAGIDQDSTPNNYGQYINRTEGTYQWSDDIAEDDTSIAPIFKLILDKSRTLSGTVFEDTDAILNDNERLGNGIYDNSENIVENVKVELLDTEGNIAKLTNGENAVTTTDIEGNYKFGGEVDVDGTTKYVGLLPGKYKVRYTYTDSSKIGAKGTEKTEIGDVSKYKSTIITSEKIKAAITDNANNMKWYIDEVDGNSNIIRYSEAIDESMERQDNEQIAKTPLMEITVEGLIEIIDGEEKLKEYSNVDFGIIERPKNDIEVSKEITHLNLTSAQGTVVIDGDPSAALKQDVEIPNVQVGDGLVSVEIASEYVQGANLKVEYTISVTNKSEINYNTSDYYYYGVKTGAQLQTMTVNKIIDYMTSKIDYDEEKNAGNWEVLDVSDVANHVTTAVSQSLKDNPNNYRIMLLKNPLENIAIGETRSVKMYVYLEDLSPDDIVLDNHAEVIDIEGNIVIEDDDGDYVIPGNYDPIQFRVNFGNPTHEKDDDFIVLSIKSPTGSDMNITIYIGIAILALAILITGIIIINKKIIRRR